MDYSSDTETDLNSVSYLNDEPCSSDSDSGTGTFSESGGDRALQLVKFSRSTDGEETLKTTVNSDVLNNVLSTCGNRRIAVINVIGSIRTGKSLLLNFAKEKLKNAEEGSSGQQRSKAYKGFNFKHGYKQVTKGIWIWSRAFIIEDDDGEVAVLLMDTEGINDELTKPDELAAILGISLLSSSLLIVNATGELSLQEFDWISSFVGKSGNQHQKVSFLVRDWARLGLHKHGQKGGKRYLDKFISQNSTKCGYITSAFQDLDCFLLPHIGEKPLLESFTGQGSDINKDFSKQVNSYLTKLLDGRSIPVKKIFDNEITGPEFKTFFLEYIKYFNDVREMEVGPKPERILAVTKETAGQLKISKGLEEYQKTFNTRRKSASGGILRDSTIGGMHVPAKRKALQAFRSFSLSPEDEKYFEAKLDEKLKKVNTDLKSENQSKKKKKLGESLEKAVTKMRKELERSFPFVPPEDINLSDEFVFYDPETLDDKVETTRQIVLTDFLKDFAGEEEDDRRDAQKEVEENLKPIETDFKSKNVKNRERAVAKATSLTEKLLKDYVAGMQKKIKRMPDANSKMLALFHEDESEKIEQKYEGITLGVEVFQEQWLAKLRKMVDREYETLQMNLESTTAEALQKILKEEKDYEKTLNELADEMEELEINKFHKNTVKSILQNFSNPFSKDHAKYDEIEGKLRERLEGVYVGIIEGGKIFKRKQLERLEKTVETALEMVQDDLDKHLQEADLLDKNECKAFLKSVQDQSLHWFVTETESIDVEQDSVKKAKEKLVEKAKKIISGFQKKNDENRKFAIEEAEKLLTTCSEDYERKIRKSVKNLLTIDELTDEHGKQKENIITQFLERLSIKSSSLTAEYTQKLEVRVHEIFEDVESHLSMKLKAEDVVLMSVLNDAKKHYQENMDKKFTNNKTGFFKDDELEKMHSQLITAAMNAATAEAQPLNECQQKKLDVQWKKLYLKYKDKNDLIRHSYSETDPAIGIDLGTTYCCVAVYHMGIVKILRNSLGTNTTPSYVTINHDGTTLVGNPAKEQAYLNPEATIFDAKRIIGRRLDDKKLQEDMKFWPFTVEEVEEKARIKVHDEHYHPEQISSMILKHLKEEAEKTLNKKIEKAVITVPAYFTDGQRQATIDAGQLAGLKVLGILNEPTAAAVAYRLEGYNLGKARKILVYDLGGGTFDVAVLKISDDIIDVLSINGDSHLGGEDFDKNMMEYCATEFHKVTEIDLFEGKDSPVKTVRDDARRRLKRLQNYCENAKKSLTNARGNITITIDEIVRGKDLNVDINRKIFDERNMSVFKKTIEIVDEALKSARVTKDEIDDVVMVGGSTRITKLQEMLEEHFKGKALNNQLNPDEAVAYGAAVQAAILNSKPGAKLFDFGKIQEVTPMSLGVEVSDGSMDVIIPKHTKIPTSHAQDYRTTKDNQGDVTVKIFQGEDFKVAAKNKLLGTFKLEGIPPGPSGKEKIDVTMKINQNGVLNVEAVCRSTKGKNSITVCEDKGRLSESEKRKLQADKRLLA